MNHLKAFILLFVVIPTLVGCTTLIRGFPQAPRTSDAMYPNPDYLLGPAALEKYNQETDQDKKKILRNEILDARMLEIDSKFGEFERELYKQGIGWGIGTDWVLLALTATTTIAGGKGTKTALGAVSTGVIGAQASLDKRALFDKTLPALMAQMVAQRETIRASMRASENLPVDSYSVYAGLSDLQRFEFGGSIPGSLQSIAEDAGQKAKSAKDELKDIRKGTYVKSQAGILLDGFWRPDGVKNEAHENELKKWMTDNGLSTAPGMITMFLFSSPELEDMRKKAVHDLGLPRKQQ